MRVGWDPSLSVGYALIDQQHQELFQRVAALCTALDGPSVPEELANTMTFLLTYFREHFGAEEGLMIVHAYPEREAHRNEHRALMRDVLDAMGRLDREGASLALKRDVEFFLVGWLRTHIAGSDAILGRWLAAHGHVEATPGSPS